MAVILVNRFHVHNGDVREFTRLWTEISKYMERQDGFASTRFSSSLREPQNFINVAVWDDAAAFKRAIEAEEFRKLSKPLAQLASAAPELYETIYES